MSGSTNFKFGELSAMDAKELASKRFQLNMARVNRLVSLGQRLKQTQYKDSDELADLYRSSIVFLYASFEDMLRTTIEIHGGDGTERTFGKVNAVCKALVVDLHLDPAPFRPLFSEMSAFMARRHRIVHEADLITATAVTDAPWTIGDVYQMAIWVLVVTTFASKLRVELDPSQVVHEWYAEERMNLIKKLTEARRTLSAAPIEGKQASLQAMADTVLEIETILKRPRDEVVRAIADKYGIAPQC